MSLLGLTSPPQIRGCSPQLMQRLTCPCAAAFSSHCPSAHPPVQGLGKESGQWLTADMPDRFPMAGHSWSRGGSRGAGAYCKTLLVSKQHHWRVCAGASAGGSHGWGGSGVVELWLHGVLCTGKPVSQLEAARSPPGMGARRSIGPNTRLVPAAPMLRHLGAPAWDPPRKAEPAQGDGKILAPTVSLGREAPSHRGVCAAGRGEARRKSRERSRFWAQWQESSAGGRSGS